MAMATESEQGYRELHSDIIHNLLADHLDRLDPKLGKSRRAFWKIIRITKGETKAPAYISVGGIPISTSVYADRIVGSVVTASLNGSGKMDIGLLKAQAFLDLAFGKEVHNGSKRNKREK